MPRTVTIHPLSLVAGAALAAVVFVSMSQSPSQAPTLLRLEYIPHPRDMVQISGAQPYAVPSGKILVITAFGHVNDSSGGYSVWIDGQKELELTVPYSSGAAQPQSETSIVPVPAGLTVHAGSLVVLSGMCQTPPCANPQLRAWGYLVNQ